MKTKFKLVKDTSSFQITWKAKSVKELLDDEGVLKGVEVEGYASTKDKDRGGDIVEPEAFKNALEMYMLNPIVLLQHDMDKPIGVVEDARIDEKGLYIKAKITENEDGVFSKLVNGVLRSFSIGYRVKDYEDRDVYNSEGVYMGSEFVIKDLELYEISVVSVPMNPYALCKSMSDCFEKEETVEEQPETVEEEKVEETPNEEENKEEVTPEMLEEVAKNLKETETVAEPVEAPVMSEIGDETEEKVEETAEENTEENTEEKVEECTTTVEQMDEIIDEAKEEKEIEETTEEKVEQEVEQVENKEEIEEAIEENTEEKMEEEIAEEVKEEEAKETVEETEIDGEDKIPEDQESENVVETTTDEKVDKGLNLKEMSRKSIETFILSETKSIKENVLEEVKSLITKKDEEIADLKEKLANTQKALTICAELVGEIDSALSNTALKSGFAYEKPQTKKQNSAYLKVAEFLKAKA